MKELKIKKKEIKPPRAPEVSFPKEMGIRGGESFQVDCLDE